MTSPPYYALRDYGMDAQIGRETTPKEYISRLTEVFTEVRRVLRPDGTLWLNISDTYAGKGNQGEFIDPKTPNGRTGQAVALNNKVEGCKPKDMIGFYFKVDVPKCSNSDENTPFADAADDETVSIPKDEYELMIDDLLTMSEIIQCVADMRTQDVKAIREFGKFVPAFAAFEKNRLSLYREAAKEAEEIFDRWADEIDDLDEDFMEDEDYELDEYYSD